MRIKKDGTIVPAPQWLVLDGVAISNPTEEHLVAAGYEPYAEPEPAEPTPLAAAESEQAQADLAAQMELERPATRAEFAELAARVEFLEGKLGIVREPALQGLPGLTERSERRDQEEGTNP